MRAIISAPLLCQLKSWQLIGLGITGWVTLYSIAIINWASCSAIVGNIQGGCFATTMALASLEARRLNKNKGELQHDSLHWTDYIPTFELNQTLGQIQQQKGFTTEMLNEHEKQMGFGVRAVKDGRTYVFETSRWKELTIDLLHAKTTDENRKKVMADRAVIVSVGVPDEDTKLFVKSSPLQLLAGEDLRNLLAGETAQPEKKAMSGLENSILPPA